MFRIYSLVGQTQFNNPSPAHKDQAGQTGNPQTGGRGVERVTGTPEGRRHGGQTRGQSGRNTRPVEGKGDGINRRKTGPQATKGGQRADHSQQITCKTRMKSHEGVRPREAALAGGGLEPCADAITVSLFCCLIAVANDGK